MANCSLATTISVLMLVAGLVLCQANKIPADIENALFRNEPTPASRALRSTSYKMNEEERHLQEFNYRANYTAQFQYLLSPECEGPAPVIRVSCHGPNITLINTSDPSIVCNTLSEPDSEPDSFADNAIPAGSTIECNNTCTGAACEGVYLAANDYRLDKPFGAIFFQCAGDIIDNVDAFVSYVDSGNGTCNTTNQEITSNYHILRMGVSCPTESGEGSEYLFDDSYFECLFPVAGSFPGDGEPGDVYTCSNGLVCSEKDVVCDVDFDTLIVRAELPNYMDKCVETSLPLTPAPTPTRPQSNYTYSAKFEASWALLSESGSKCTSSISPTVKVTCLNGDIKFVNSTYGTTSCTTVNESTMECNDSNSDNLSDKFTGVAYECSGPEFPETMIEYPEEVAFCVGNGNSTGRHAVQLGVFCNSGEGEFLFSGDAYFDCVDVSPQFSLLDEFGSTGGTRYTCSQSATFSSGSTAEQTLPSVAISTDLYWVDYRGTNCFDFGTASATPSPSTEAPVTSSPSKAPVTSPPTQAPLTPSPTRSAVTSTTIPTVSGLGTSRDVPTSEESQSSSSGGGSAIGAAVGGAVGGIVLVGIVAFLVLRRRPGSNSVPVPVHKDRDSAPVILAAADNDDHSPTESETGRIVVESGYSHQAEVASSTPEEMVSKGDSAAAAHDSAQQSLYGSLPASLPGSLSSSSPRSSRRRPSGPVQYKDQVRSVVEVPLVEATAVAQLIDTSSASGETGVSRRSDPDGRRSIDP